jgi:hypothetical protein
MAPSASASDTAASRATPSKTPLPVRSRAMPSIEASVVAPVAVCPAVFANAPLQCSVRQ